MVTAPARCARVVVQQDEQPRARERADRLVEQLHARQPEGLQLGVGGERKGGHGRVFVPQVDGDGHAHAVEAPIRNALAQLHEWPLVQAEDGV